MRNGSLVWLNDERCFAKGLELDMEKGGERRVFH